MQVTNLSQTARLECQRDEQNVQVEGKARNRLPNEFIMLQWLTFCSSCAANSVELRTSETMLLYCREHFIGNNRISLLFHDNSIQSARIKY